MVIAFTNSFSYYKCCCCLHSNIEEVEDLEKVYDYIRMLDADGYPAAFLETENLKLEFTKAHFNRDEEIITAHVRIFKK